MRLRITWPKIDRGTFLYVFAASFLVGAIAYINRYPLVYSDSGSYILSSFTLKASPDRPVGYPLIIRAVTWQSTLWTVVLFQSFMTSWLIYEVLKQLLPPQVAVWRVHLVVVATLLLVTSMPWYEAQIMPDALTPLILLILFLLLMGDGLAMYKRFLLWACLFFFIIAHFSHVAMTGLFLGGIVVYNLVRPKRGARPAFWVRWTGPALALVGSVAFAIIYNSAQGYRPVLSPASNVFFCGRLCEDDILRDFLREHCGERRYVLCPYTEELPELPGDLIWGDHSVFSRTGMSFEEADTAFTPIIRDLLTEPEYLGRYIRSAFIGTVLQVFQVNTNSGVVSFYKDSAPYAVIKERLPWEANAYIHSTQAYNNWDMAFVTHWTHLALLLAVLVLALAWPRNNAQSKLRFFLGSIVAWVLLNAAITSSLANVYDRLQSRVMWLIVLAACVALAHTRRGKRIVEASTSTDRI